MRLTENKPIGKELDTPFMKTKKLKLYGFNNLTKTLSFNIYDICYAVSDESRRQYIEYIDEQYNAERLTNILRNVSDIIGAHILNVASQDYDPQAPALPSSFLRKRSTMPTSSAISIRAT